MQNLDLEKVKCIIFDFDATLYTGADWNGYSDYFYGIFVDIGAFGSVSEAHEKLLELYPDEPEYEQRAVFYLHDNEHLFKKFMQRRDDEIFDITSDYMQFCDYSLLSKLSKYYKLYLISDSPQSYLHFYLKKFGIDENDFQMVCANKYAKEDITKFPLMRDAMIDADASPDETLMIGDSLKYDKRPAEKLGIQFYLTKSVNETDAIMKELLKIKNN